MVVRSSEIKPLAKEITYKCSNNHEFHITLEKRNDSTSTIQMWK